LLGFGEERETPEDPWSVLDDLVGNRSGTEIECQSSCYEPTCRAAGKARIRPLYFLPHHKGVDLQHYRVFLDQLPYGGKQSGLAVIAGSERDEDGLLDGVAG
jgi:hypothetical protein